MVKRGIILRPHPQTEKNGLVHIHALCRHAA